MKELKNVLKPYTRKIVRARARACVCVARARRAGRDPGNGRGCPRRLPRGAPPRPRALQRLRGGPVEGRARPKRPVLPGERSRAPGRPRGACARLPAPGRQSELRAGAAGLTPPEPPAGLAGERRRGLGAGRAE